MSLRKAFTLSKTVSIYNHSPKFNLTNSKRTKWLFTADSVRTYSTENIDKKDRQPEKVDILGRFFPQAPLSSEDAQTIKKEQEQFDKENKEKNEENEKSWKRMKIGFGVFGGALTVMGGCLVVEMGAPRRGEDGQLLEDEFSNQPLVLQYLKRTWKELTFYEKMIKEPSREKLLPDPLPAPYQPTYTLVLEFTDVLVHPDWSYQTGWRFKKRPGLDQFLQTVANSNFEVVIFTTENVFMIWPVIDKLDPENKLINYRLFRDSTHFIDGVHVKNLDGLNRDLSKVIVVDWNKASTKFHPQNTLILNKWKGVDDDTTLLDLANLLQTIAMSEVADVREVLTYYSQFDDPIAMFRENQRRLLEQLEQKERQAQDQPLTRNWLRSFTRR
ncbi:mitochondrial import inner membrane translocase subunit TIM50-C-like isoform X2 [Plodia interpunctella]|uniref:mitochondrial import inner membrane translocase subunit TIM50-C-like isoform X2 n=1 Tax=Plodia interpunctella TaxID=58824 RepID=UPI0023685E22|nr:mitochondrial import inner membrane translocase subunit TIM50-C-like isoform X3 [Plodia interpunctella]XP_053611827.1 mitochondrial import inner membrane translocase subunit TIM50-C-like isoform X4 [Plodia interpunctella]